MQRIRRTFADTGNVTLGIVAAAFLLLLIIILPRVIPGGRFGVACSALASPLPGGNNQSILARTRSIGTLDLEISLARTTTDLATPLTINVTFVNDGVGTITLFFKEDEFFIGDDGADGLSFLFRSAEAATLYSESPTRVSRPTTRTEFTNDTLHLLGPKQRCTETITIEPARLIDITNPSGARIGSGTYRISALYRNRSAGQITANAAQVFNDQGVYVTQQDVLANEEILIIGQ